MSSECSLGVCNSCGEEAKNRSPDVQRRKETPVSAHPPPPSHLAATCKAGPGDPHGEQG